MSSRYKNEDFTLAIKIFSKFDIVLTLSTYFIERVNGINISLLNVCNNSIQLIRSIVKIRLVVEKKNNN